MEFCAYVYACSNVCIRYVVLCVLLSVSVCVYVLACVACEQCVCMRMSE